MTFTLFSALALPLWAAVFAMYFILKKARLMRESLIAKCAGSFIGVASCVTALYMDGQNPFFSPVFWFLVLCTLADALLEISFIPGMLLFGAAHICLLWWMAGLLTPSLISLFIFVTAVVIMVLIFRKQLKKLGKTAVVFLLYGLILSAVLALALPVSFALGGGYWCICAGAVMFVISDLMVAAGQFGIKGLEKLDRLVMLLYWGALYLFSAALWL